jgi:hypothetical protein
MARRMITAPSASAFSQCAPQSRQVALGQSKSRLLRAHYRRLAKRHCSSKADAALGTLKAVLGGKRPYPMMPANVGTADILQVIFAKANPLNCRAAISRAKILSHAGMTHHVKLPLRRNDRLAPV